MISMLRNLVGVSIFLCAAGAGAAAMTVHLDQMERTGAGGPDARWVMSLAGEIDAAAPARVRAALARSGSAGVEVYLDSTGGDLLAGMEIGQLLRQAGANTHVGRYTAARNGQAAGVAPGVCYSACSLAFLGGVYRYAGAGSQYGVHRVSRASGPAAGDLDTGQIVSAGIARYIRGMGVGQGLLDLLVQQGEHGIYLLSDAEMKALNVVNNGRQPADWSVEITDGGEFLRGMQDTEYGRGKIAFLCDQNKILMFTFDQVGDKAASLATGSWVHSLLLDGGTVALPDPDSMVADKGELQTFFTLTAEQAGHIAASRSVGHVMRAARDAPALAGFTVEIPAAAAQKIRAFINHCIAVLP
ncbi:hypothetical protein [Collimonas sp.]|jgi:hypothetical protein|uniref:COG3904 family protein n=1 Tax=Collimonas sp. TaxID=1963772 RepID=UPI002BBBBEC1|nr:hypothetical protein [Collimonas sp.]HWW99416.1 hypothetical protein [Collimonas sp.]